ncbi:hypothetical protein BBF96_14560 [Anoxybacter fermentans]|uniref:Prepilin-type N-terminal cleavage/methylation domain-containing protein n=1 Tax=Anoxybacter fermentans TaxID=1323375 RepID=A0A3S9T1U7_9FIRM|nr:prepilin-type N-terminal cleavage/methylation domain-containing protein [Anoxybacter fermentans]AZR74499.1 hypothetical protein BBF96_14560 [Anoxybacter fermentans]
MFLRRFLKSKEGFTLIELLVVLAVLGILAAVAVPRFANMQDKANLIKAKTELKQVQTAMELYYAENGEYPADEMAFNDALNTYLVSDDLNDYTFTNYQITVDGYSVQTTVDGTTITITRTNIQES